VTDPGEVLLDRTLRAPKITADAILSADGWDRRYARVLLIEQSGNHAMVLVDGNGDGDELELEFWKRSARGTWRERASSGYGALGSVPPIDAGISADEGLAYAIGRAQPGTDIRISYANSTYSRQANDLGIWGFIRDLDADSREAPSFAG
jgi:hypothetical protein